MYKLRSRIVNFRVSDEELELLKIASAQQGARCLSEFARSVMLQTCGTAPSQPADGDRLGSIEERLSAVESNVTRIKNALVSLNALSANAEG
jgi:hypothetical protein